MKLFKILVFCLLLACLASINYINPIKAEASWNIPYQQCPNESFSGNSVTFSPVTSSYTSNEVDYYYSDGTLWNHDIRIYPDNDYGTYNFTNNNSNNTYTVTIENFYTLYDPNVYYFYFSGLGCAIPTTINTEFWGTQTPTNTPTPTPTITPTPTATPAFFDDFHDSDNTPLPNHNNGYSPDNHWRCNSNYGIPAINNNQLTFPANNTHQCYVDLDFGDATINVNYERIGNYGEFYGFFRADTTNWNFTHNSYLTDIYNGHQAIYRYSSGVETLLCSNSQFITMGTHNLSITYAGSNITVNLDNSQILNCNDSGSTISSGHFGFSESTGDINYNSLAIIDNTTPTPTPTAIVHNQPSTSASLAPNPDAQNEYPNPVTVTLQATADTNYTIAHTYYTVDGGAQQTYSAPFTVPYDPNLTSRTVTYWSVDNAGLEETPHKSQTFTISSTAIDTSIPSGQNQTVTIGNAALTFSDVTTAGYIVQTTSSNNAGGALPSEYKLLGTYYDLTTTASYTGTITVTLSYDPAAVKNQNNLKLWHFDGTTWHDITTAVDTVNHTITGTTSSLSPFAIGEKDATPPTFTNFQLSPYVVANGNSSTISVSAQDDLTGVHTVSYSLTSSSGQVTTGDLSFISPSGVWQASISPTTGVYAVKITATDFTGNQSTSDNLYLAVYDSSAGYVTGGGWVTTADATRVGVSSGAKTNFGFNVKYLSNNSSNPDGSFEMNDKQDGLNIKSASLEWLTVSGSTADFQGQATVNGSGSYTFRAHIVDGSPDQFDVRVWGSDKSFDNPTYRITNSLGGGSIVIHQ